MGLILNAIEFDHENTCWKFVCVRCGVRIYFKCQIFVLFLSINNRLVGDYVFSMYAGVQVDFFLFFLFFLLRMRIIARFRFLLHFKGIGAILYRNSKEIRMNLEREKKIRQHHTFRKKKTNFRKFNHKMCSKAT